MRSVYERTNLIITEFDNEDVITTSGGGSAGPTPTEPPVQLFAERENRYGSYSFFNEGSGSWFS